MPNISLKVFKRRPVPTDKLVASLWKEYNQLLSKVLSESKKVPLRSTLDFRPVSTVMTFKLVISEEDNKKLKAYHGFFTYYREVRSKIAILAGEVDHTYDRQAVKGCVNLLRIYLKELISVIIIVTRNGDIEEWHRILSNVFISQKRRLEPITEEEMSKYNLDLLVQGFRRWAKQTAKVSPNYRLLISDGFSTSPKASLNIIDT